MANYSLTPSYQCTLSRVWLVLDLYLPYSRKVWQWIKFSGLAVYLATAKLKNRQYLILAYNIPNSRQYFLLYGSSCVDTNEWWDPQCFKTMLVLIWNCCMGFILEYHCQYLLCKVCGDEVTTHAALLLTFTCDAFVSRESSEADHSPPGWACLKLYYRRWSAIREDIFCSIPA